MQEVLCTVNQLSSFSNCFEHLKQNHNKQIPGKLLIAGIMSLGYGMGNNEIASIAKGISRSALDNTVNWCFTTENVRNAIDSILKLTTETGIPDLYLESKQKIHTSSDGQKWKVINDSLNASYFWDPFWDPSNLAPTVRNEAGCYCSRGFELFSRTNRHQTFIKQTHTSYLGTGVAD